MNTTEDTQNTCGCDEGNLCPCDANDCDEVCGEDCKCEHGVCCDTDSSDELDDDNNSIFRGKWIYDGSSTIDEMIECLEREIRLLNDLKNDGWYLLHKVEDDYAFIRRDPPETDTV